MRCKVCGREMKKTMGVHFIDGRWLQLEADYCFQHGSFVTNLALQNAIEVVPDVMQRDHIRPGLHVLIHKKAAAIPIYFEPKILASASRPPPIAIP